MSKKRRVAIIGAGPSGLMCAKYALNSGLAPVVFEKSRSPGGLWIPESGFTWHSLQINSSKFTTSFIDHPWPRSAAMQPTNREVYEYIMDYVDKNKLVHYIQLNRLVVKVNQSKIDDTWTLTILNLNTNEETVQTFDFLIVATGVNSKPNIPKIDDIENFRGTVIHSSEYKSPEQFYSKRVLVIGGSSSALQISVDLVARRLTQEHTSWPPILNVFHRPYLIIPNWLRVPQIDNVHFSFIPYDFYLFTREFSSALATNTGPQQQKQIIEEKLGQISKQVASSCPASLRIDLGNDNLRLAISDQYLDYVKSEHITSIKSWPKRFEPRGVWLEDGTYHDGIDAVIFATSYQLHLDFFDEATLDTLNYQPAFYKYPIVLYENTFHPDLKGLAFVGCTRSYFYCGAELQAKWVCKILAGEMEMPNTDEMRKKIEVLLEERPQKSQLQFPHGDYVKMVDGMAKKLNLLPDFKKLKFNNSPMYELLYEKAVFPFHFSDKIDQNLVDELNEIYEKIYTIE